MAIADLAGGREVLAFILTPLGDFMLASHSGPETWTSTGYGDYLVNSHL